MNAQMASVERHSFMKIMKSVWAVALLILASTAGMSPLLADTTIAKARRGHAYGYFLKDGVHVLFTYFEEDGSRLIELSNCRPQARYLVEFSADCANWSAFVTLTAQGDGTASCTDASNLSMCFYRVSRTK